MRKSLRWLALAAALVGGIGIACATQTTIITQPTPITSDTDSDFPDEDIDGNCSLIEGVRIAKFTASCTVGPGNALTPGCTWEITATPLLAGSQPAPIEVHGTDIEWTATPGVVEVRARGSNPFNKTIVIFGGAPVGSEWSVTAANCGKGGSLIGTVR